MDSNENMCSGSKEKLTQKELVSCLDYYTKQHILKLERTAVCGTYGGVRGQLVLPYSIGKKMYVFITDIVS